MCLLAMDSSSVNHEPGLRGPGTEAASALRDHLSVLVQNAGSRSELSEHTGDGRLQRLVASSVLPSVDPSADPGEPSV